MNVRDETGVVTRAETWAAIVRVIEVDTRWAIEAVTWDARPLVGTDVIKSAIWDVTEESFL